jgi:membrane protease subunit (stomatin/prohibitin family)
MAIIAPRPKQMPESPDLVLYHQQAPDLWGLYVVRPYERVIFIDNGRVEKVLDGGRHNVERFPLIDVVDVIWVALKNFRLGFYVQAYSRETVEVRMWGFSVLKVADVESFLRHVVGGQRVYDQEALSTWIRGHMMSVIRSRTASSTYSDYISDRAAFIERMRADLEKVMLEYGLGVTTIEIERIKIPEDLEETLKEGVKSSITADVLKTKGAAVSEVYKGMTNAGVNPATIEFFKTLTGRDMSEIFTNLGVSPQEVASKLSGQAQTAGLLGKGSGTQTGPMDLMLSLFAMQMMQNMTGVSMGKPAQPQVAATPPPPTPPPAPSPTQAAKCLKCSEPLPASAKFCPGCGAATQVPRCAQCGAELPETAKFCPQCGKQVGLQ